MKRILCVSLAALAFAGSVQAAPLWQKHSPARFHAPSGGLLLGLREPATTGSLMGRPAHSLRDRQGRDLRSSTRGNAQFPERLPTQQNLGSTAGGPEY